MKLKNTPWAKEESENDRDYSRVDFKGWFNGTIYMEVYKESNVYKWEAYFEQLETSGLEPDLESAKKAAEGCVLNLFKSVIDDS